ncbi:MAG: hypothetical protein AAGD25_14390 [Cyanobacteria bacterium P01_F01_bin.150]
MSEIIITELVTVNAIAPSDKPGKPTICTSLTVIETRSILSISCNGTIAKPTIQLEFRRAVS